MEAEIVSPETRAALEAAFEDWYARNYNVLEGGGLGDVVHLYSTLMLAAEKTAVP